MAEPNGTPEKPVTAQDLRDKWDEIKQTARRGTQRRVLGMTVLTVGGIALGLGALGAAFWLGRRRSARCRAAAAPEEAPEAVAREEAPARPQRRSSAVSRALEPALDSAVNTVVNAAVKSAVNALTKRLRET